MDENLPDLRAMGAQAIGRNGTPALRPVQAGQAIHVPAASRDLPEVADRDAASDRGAGEVARLSDDTARCIARADLACVACLRRTAPKPPFHVVWLVTPTAAVCPRRLVAE